jgi:hypothetical protein
MTPLGAVLIVAAVFVVLGAAATLGFGDWLRSRQRRKQNQEPEDETW